MSLLLARRASLPISQIMSANLAPCVMKRSMSIVDATITPLLQAEYRFPDANKTSGRPLSTISDTSVYTAARSTPILPGQAPSPQIVQGAGTQASSSRTSTDDSEVLTDTDDAESTEDTEQYATPDPSLDSPHQYTSVGMSPSCSTSSSASSSLSFASSTMSRSSTTETNLTCPSPVMTRNKTLRPVPLCASPRRRAESQACQMPISPKGTTIRRSPPSQWAAVAESRRIPFTAQQPSKGPYTFPSPTPIDELRAGDLESSLRFTTQGRATTSSEPSAPPAFFPLQRVSFAPQLRVRTAGGVPLAISAAAKQSGKRGIAGMMLGVTGTIEILDVEKGKKLGR